jgi:hypothetical protein
MMTRNKYVPQNNTETPDQAVVSDRLKVCAETIRAERNIPDVSICDAIGDSSWFREYCNICLQQPIANSFLGCILFGWQLCEEYNKIRDLSSPIIYRA